MKRLALAAALLALAALPLWVGNTFYVNIATQILLYAVFALGINVLVGYAGLVTLGHAGLFGVAAYFPDYDNGCDLVRRGGPVKALGYGGAVHRVASHTEGDMLSEGIP